MPNCEVTGDGLFLMEGGREIKCLISFWEFYKNLGALPLHTYNSDTERIMPRVLRELEGMGGGLDCMLAAAAVFRQSLLGYRPLQVLMTGGNGQMMAVLERAAREAHPGSRVYALDGDSSFLRDSFFDLAVIGAELPAEAMRGIARAVRNGGSVTSVYGGGFEERRVTEGIRTESPGLGDEMRGLRAKLARVMGESPEQLSAVIAVLTEMERLAIKLFDIADIDLKQRVIEAKENALNALYAPDGAYRADQLERLGEYITGKG